MFAVILVSPLIFLGLMLLMERVERPLRHKSVADELEGFLDSARPDEVETFVSQGFGPAIEAYWARRRPGVQRSSA
ncbi:MAG: hypothetical protein QOG52_220 [Frankiaceae bacterium]|jgi:hypothetical protein|nr:hypothetical protein [Frankiaceae bacterium]MDQ1715483.1 hypothetical protein [Frankiaceae bacterium]MDQ1723192.1 hypothetical protein [Frankiaceae bacterium]